MKIFVQICKSQKKTNSYRNVKIIIIFKKQENFVCLRSNWTFMKVTDVIISHHKKIEERAF